MVGMYMMTTGSYILVSSCLIACSHCCPELCVQNALMCTCTVAVDKPIQLPPPFVVVEPVVDIYCI